LDAILIAVLVSLMALGTALGLALARAAGRRPPEPEDDDTAADETDAEGRG
jgi:hypothetical protein